jgi:glucose/arabinose dehydrogenase
MQSSRSLIELNLALITHQQPAGNHNGGTLLFAPTTPAVAAAAAYYDLYIPTGDGGFANDPQKHAQDLTSLLGKVLRIRLSTAPNAQGYTVPPDNPYAASTGKQSTTVMLYICALLPYIDCH